ncbi:hypothetical protein HOLleu_07611 [Holothuria leucospilota]|uniref:Uncharacterized protein n=1 Tax=Holothuria leucospilota TaxID=206669 RepID=A0A9Q1CGY0_HOLLE|nr:hypothetical protein HOLleu_07611 [Holothuria leucospilota]
MADPNTKELDPFKVDNSPSGELSDNDRCFQDNFAPLAPIPGPVLTNDEAHQSLQSRVYLAHLENKLKKLKGQNPSSRVSSKDIITSLCKVRLDASENLVSTENTVFSEEPVGEQRLVEVNDLKRRMLPEQALTLEELTYLLERDYLNAVTQYIRKDDDDNEDENIDNQAR